MVQIPTRARARPLPFSLREACQAQYGRPRPPNPLARGEEPDAKRARQSYAPIHVPRTAIPLAPKSVNLTVTAVPFPTDDAATEDAEHEDPTWGTSAMPIPISPGPRQKRLVARTSAPTPPPISIRVAPPPPTPTPSLPEPSSLSTTPTPPHLATRARRPSPLAPYWKPTNNENGMCVPGPTRTRRGRVPPEPLARRALKTHFARTTHGAAVVKMGARRAIAQAECIAAVERVKQACGVIGSEIVNARRGAVGSIGVTRAQLAPPMVMVSPPSPTKVGSAALPVSMSEEWVPLSVQPMEVEPTECDIVEMETGEWSRL